MIKRLIIALMTDSSSREALKYGTFARPITDPRTICYNSLAIATLYCRRRRQP
jgi:hypothetical protein